MLNISMVRVDERLVHGQIIMKWLEIKKSKRIIIIDDQVASDPIMGNILRMALPQDIKLEIYSLEDGTNILKSDGSKEDVIVLTKYLWIVKKMNEKGVEIEEVNIGRIPSGVGRKKVYANVFLSYEDMDAINYFQEKRISVVVQIVPDSLPVNIKDLLK